MDIGLTNITGLPVSLELALNNNKYDKGDGADASATEILMPPRLRQLRARHHVTEDVSERIYSLLGTLTHKILEGSTRELVKDDKTTQLEAIEATLDRWMAGEIEGDLPTMLDAASWEAVRKAAWENHNVMIEERKFARILGWILSGKPDRYDGNLKLLEDYKLCSVWNWIYGAKVEWEQQLNIYRYIFHLNGLEVEQANIHAIFRDWSKTKAAVDPKYPQKQWIVMPMNIWSIEKCKEFVEERIRIHQEAALVEEKDLPLCTDEERWSSGEKWALMKKGRKSAVKLFDSSSQAMDWKGRYQKPGEILTLEHRPSVNTRCVHYCVVSHLCPFGISLKKEDTTE